MRIKKLRGARRYYRGLRQRGDAFWIDLGPDRWYDLWHQHFDCRGYSRRSGRARTRHLEALFTAFRRTVAQANAAGRPVQVFVSIAPDCVSEQDALYVHTPNPNGTPFPHPFDDVQWGMAAPPRLRAFLQNATWEIGVTTKRGERWWVVRLADSN